MLSLNGDDRPQPGTGLMTPGEVAVRRRVTVQAVYHWINYGKQVKGGGRVYLEAERDGGQWRITEEAYRKFQRECDPRTWRRVGEKQAAERRQAKRDQKRLREKLGSNRRVK